MGDLKFTSFTPRDLFFIIPFLLENVYSKKSLLLIPTEGKKWCSHYNQQHIGGKMWEYMVSKSGGICVKGIVPPSTRH
jgi:hypothetical protein